MAKIIGLPKLSPTMEEGTLVRWVKQEGDPIEVDDLVAEVETDKATMEFRSFDKGVLLKQLAPEGATLQPDQPVAILGKAGEDISELLKQAGAAGDQGKAAPSEAAQPAREANAAPEAEPAESTGVRPAAPEEPGRAQGRRVLASPLVRKMAREQDIDLTSVRGSGPNGRVIKRDLEALGARVVGLPGAPLRGPSVPPPAQRPAPAAVRAPVPPALPAGEIAGRVEKLSQMRKTIARRLSESKREVPHFYLTIDVDAEPLTALRAMLNEQLASMGEKVSLNDLLIKACAVALRLFPRANASFLGDTPVVRNADRLGVLAISQTVRDLAARAKDKKLKPEEMQNGTFSISNLGMYGIDSFSAVINPPEGAILAVGAVRDVPVVKDGAVVPGKRMSMTMSCDHRVIDGAVGAEWLKVLRGVVENPLSMLL
jgi:pyruvate dehydrogenase E2 component (dihydrolipoamide acetyltransferase)